MHSHEAELAQQEHSSATSLTGPARETLDGSLKKKIPVFNQLFLIFWQETNKTGFLYNHKNSNGLCYLNYALIPRQSSQVCVHFHTWLEAQSR